MNTAYIELKQAIQDFNNLGGSTELEFCYSNVEHHLIELLLIQKAFIKIVDIVDGAGNKHVLFCNIARMNIANFDY